MEESILTAKKDRKVGPLKSTPGFLKCLRNVYLYFKEEKEKGALNIPINSFIQRTAVACGVGKKMLYNYAKKGLFDEQPILLQPKTKKKKGKRKTKAEESQNGKKKKKTCPVQTEPGPSSSPERKEAPTIRLAKNVMIQTDPRPVNPSESFLIQAAAPDGFTNFIINRDPGKVQQIQVAPPTKTGHVLAGPWPTGTGGTTTTTTAIGKKDVDYFSKNNIWHAVYNVHATDSQTDLNAGRLASCQQQEQQQQQQQQQPTSDHLGEL